MYCTVQNYWLYKWMLWIQVPWNTNQQKHLFISWFSSLKVLHTAKYLAFIKTKMALDSHWELIEPCSWWSVTLYTVVNTLIHITINPDKSTWSRWQNVGYYSATFQVTLIQNFISQNSVKKTISDGSTQLCCQVVINLIPWAWKESS